MNGADDNNIGAVAELENIKTPCSVARLVMDRTDHWLLAGRDALLTPLTQEELDSIPWR
jgi:isoaspartyl peptidase/L-asparaginase-like protein (Ntn-hydrolase superfamily)